MRRVHTRVNKEAKRDLTKVSWYRTLFRRWPIGGDVEGYVSKRPDRWRRPDRERDLNVEPVPFFLSLFCCFVDVVDVGFIIWDLTSDGVSSFIRPSGLILPVCCSAPKEPAGTGFRSRKLDDDRRPVPASFPSSYHPFGVRPPRSRMIRACPPPCNGPLMRAPWCSKRALLDHERYLSTPDLRGC